MAKRTKVSLGWTLIVMILLLILAFMLFMPRKMIVDNFQSMVGVTSSSLYFDPKVRSHNAFVAEYEDRVKLGLLDDRNDLLHMRGCYQFPATDNIYQKLINMTQDTDKAILRIGPFYTNDIYDVTKQVSDTIKRECEIVRNKTGNSRFKFVGDIYVVIFQAPYHKASDGSIMSIQYNLNDYEFMPVNIMAGSSVQKQRNIPLDIDAFIIFSSYNKNYSKRRIPYRLDEEYVDKRVHVDICKMRCVNGSNRNMLCGCKTQTKNRNTHYLAKCLHHNLGAETIEDKNKAYDHDFPIVYVVNNQYELVTPYVS